MAKRRTTFETLRLRTPVYELLERVADEQRKPLSEVVEYAILLLALRAPWQLTSHVWFDKAHGPALRVEDRHEREAERLFGLGRKARAWNSADLDEFLLRSERRAKLLLHTLEKGVAVGDRSRPSPVVKFGRPRNLEFYERVAGFLELECGWLQLLLGHKLDKQSRQKVNSLLDSTRVALAKLYWYAADSGEAGIAKYVRDCWIKTLPLSSEDRSKQEPPRSLTDLGTAATTEIALSTARPGRAGRKHNGR